MASQGSDGRLAAVAMGQFGGYAKATAIRIATRKQREVPCVQEFMLATRFDHVLFFSLTQMLGPMELIHWEYDSSTCLSIDLFSVGPIWSRHLPFSHFCTMEEDH